LKGRTAPFVLANLLALTSALNNAGANTKKSPVRSSPLPPLVLMLDRPPATLNPRMAFDANGQRINMLLFRALTRLDANLEARPDLSHDWKIEDQGKTWRFRIRSALKDHEGNSIDGEKIAACLENYRNGKPESPLKAAFPNWTQTEFRKESQEVVLRLSRFDPYFARNLSALRYFTTPGQPSPCAQPSGDSRLVTNSLYRFEKWESAPEKEILLMPEPFVFAERNQMAPTEAESIRPLRIVFVPDDNARIMSLLRGEVDLTQNSLSLSKTRWAAHRLKEKYDLLEREGTSVSYLAFNMNDSILSKREVRRAIALAIPREDYIRHKLFGFCKKVGSFLSPLLPESLQTDFAHDPERAKALLDQAGFPVRKDGTRFSLRYKTTPVREGMETALFLKSALQRVGIELILESVEPAVFLKLIKKGSFQLYSSRWVGLADGSILFRTLQSTNADNRVRYNHPEVDRWIEAAQAELDPQKRLQWLHALQKQMAEDLPYFPLWTWNNALLVRKELKHPIPASALSLSGSLEPLSQLW
jgi:peptide/nickel transport system substrate-binding protein